MWPTRTAADNKSADTRARGRQWRGALPWPRRRTLKGTGFARDVWAELGTKVKVRLGGTEFDTNSPFVCSAFVRPYACRPRMQRRHGGDIETRFVRRQPCIVSQRSGSAQETGALRLRSLAVCVRACVRACACALNRGPACAPSQRNAAVRVVLGGDSLLNSSEFLDRIERDLA